MQISEVSAGCSLLIRALPVQLLLKTQMLRSFIRILASNYPLQIKLINWRSYKIIVVQLDFAGLLEPSFKCSIKYACELCCFTTWKKWNKVKLGWLAYQTTFWGDVNRNDCHSPDLFPFIPGIMYRECSSSLLPMKKVRMLGSLPMIAVFTMQFWQLHFPEVKSSSYLPTHDDAPVRG